MAKSTRLAAIVAWLACGCAGGPPSHLVPPSSATQQDIDRDMAESLKVARSEVLARGELPNEADKTLLRGHPTKGFLREGRPWAMRDGELAVPAPNHSLFVDIPSCLYPIIYPKGVPWFGPEEVTDRYVIGLLGRGYSWPEDGTPPVAPGRRHPDSGSGGIEKPSLDVRLGHLVATPWELLYLQWDQSDEQGVKPYSTVGKYVMMPFLTLAATPFYLVGYYLPGGRLWDWERVERDRMRLSAARPGTRQATEAGQVDSVK